jgi:hypothetical protein
MPPKTAYTHRWPTHISLSLNFRSVEPCMHTSAVNYKLAGHLPIIKIGSRSYIESNAALRLVSRHLKLYGADPEADYTTDMAADIVVEARCGTLCMFVCCTVQPRPCTAC